MNNICKIENKHSICFKRYTLIITNVQCHWYGMVVRLHYRVHDESQIEVQALL